MELCSDIFWAMGEKISQVSYQKKTHRNGIARMKAGMLGTKRTKTGADKGDVLHVQERTVNIIAEVSRNENVENRIFRQQISQSERR
jgi:hypothetical protein